MRSQPPSVVDLAVYIGIDPGVGGGLAVLSGTGEVLSAVGMPETPHDIGAWFKAHLYHADGQPRAARAVLEHVWSSPGWGHAGAFTFGKSFGRLEQVLADADVVHELAVPRKWQKAMGVVIPKDTPPTARKNISKARAQQLFPTSSVTHAVADAMLIAEYCRRLEAGRLTRPANEDTNGKEGKATRTEQGKVARRQARRA